LRDLDMIRQFMTSQGVFAFSDAPWIPIFMILLYILHPWYGFFSIVAAIGLFILAFLQEFGVRKSIRAATTVNIEAMKSVDTNLRNSEVVEAMGMRHTMFERWREKHLATLTLQASASDLGSLVTAATRYWQLVMQVMIFAVGAYLTIYGHVTVGALIAASILLGRTLQPVGMVVGAWPQFINARHAHQRLNELLRMNPPEPPRMPLPAPVGNLSVEGVVIVPPGAQIQAVRGATFSLKAGEMMAIVGPSAAGKSSLARAIVGVWQPVQGKVRLDGADLVMWDRKALGPHIGYLPQDVELFDGTVADNIARMNAPDPDAIVAAAKLANVHEMILRLEQGYDTKLGEGGQVLSGGQRQRVGLARAVYGLPRLIVLDEPNSNLDRVGEAALAQALTDLKGTGATVIVITHRLDLLKLPDKVLVLNNGVQERFGSRDEVMAAYARPTVISAPASAS
jgi:ATP-binding cassette subfamily C protein EexD